MKAPRVNGEAGSSNSGETVKASIPDTCPSSPNCRPTTDEMCFFCRHCFAVLSCPLTAKAHLQDVAGRA